MGDRRHSKSKGGAYVVVPSDSGWAVKQSGKERASSTHSTQADAIKAANSAVRTTGGEVRIQGMNGRWRESFVIGRDQMSTISSIEGLHLSSDMKKDFREFDRRDLSDDERRKAIDAKYGKKRA